MWRAGVAFCAGCALGCGGLLDPGDVPSREDAGAPALDASTSPGADAAPDPERPPVFAGADAYIDPGIPCGTFDKIPTTCSVTGGKVCCMPYRDSLFSAFDYDLNRCMAPAECTKGLAVECNGSGDCVNRGKPGTVCCVQYATGAFPETLRSIACVPFDECKAQRHLVLCDSKAPGACPEGTRCKQLFARPLVEGCQ
jgi:hypothetical protein